MIRLAWRQFRAEAVIGLGVLVVVAVVFAVTGPHLVSVFRTQPNSLSSTDETLQTAVESLLVIAPALIGVFFGAPLIARELETGTFRLAWTQGVTRRRWLIVKLALVGAASSLLAGGLSLLATWWANPINIVNANRFSPANFGMFGIVPFGYALFAFALGATTGLLFRRMLPAMATTIVGYVAARYAATFLVRPHFEAPLRAIAKLSLQSGFGFDQTSTGLSVLVQPATSANDWPLSAQLVDKSGREPTSAFLQKASASFTNSAPGHSVGLGGRIGGGRHSAPVPGTMQSCISNIAAKFHEVVSYQPASRYWPFQIYETALFMVVAVALAALSVWWARRRLT